MSILTKKIKSLPPSPGVYIFYGGSARGGFRKAQILYVGKATSLKDRVSSYFQSQNNYTRPIEIKIDQVEDIEIRKADTVLEAYILEQKLIKELQPKYNAMGKDDRSFCYVLVTKEEFPRFIIMRKTEVAQNTKYQIQYIKIYGPYTSRKQIETALKILRRIFPYHSMKQKTEKGCLDYQLGKCPGPYAGEISKVDYRRNIRGIRMILEGKKKNLIIRMKKEMEEYSRKLDYESAKKIRNQIFALQYIQDVSLISADSEQRTVNNKYKFRIEGYDVSDISGQYAVGSMVVFDNSAGELKPNKGEYRKFKIRTIKGANDVGAMEEILMRRFKNNWPKPNLIILDGGQGHLNMARQVLRIYRYDIPILAAAKGPERKKLDLYFWGAVPKIPKNIIEQIRDEAHRFAISYHRKLRSQNTFRPHPRVV